MVSEDNGGWTGGKTVRVMCFVCTEAHPVAARMSGKPLCSVCFNSVMDRMYEEASA